MANLTGVVFDNAKYMSTKIASVCKQLFPYSDAIINASFSVDIWDRTAEQRHHHRNLQNASRMMDDVMEMNEEAARKWIEEHESN